MTRDELLQGLLQRLDEALGRYTELDKHYGGESPLSFLSPEARTALGNRLRRVSVNVPRLLVGSVAERLRVTGIGGDADVWGDWKRLDLDQQSTIVHREALALGACYAIVWADRLGRPLVSVESAKQVAVQRDPATRAIVAACKRWEDPQQKATFAVLYEPDRITRYRANATGATITGFKVVDELANPLLVPPVAAFTNTSRLLDEGRSEMADVLDLSDALTKLTTDMLVASEYGARPRRWASGIELVEEPKLDNAGNPVLDAGQPVTETRNPFPEGDRMMVSEASEAKFGQLAGADLAGYENAIGVVMREISAVSGLPEHMLGIGGDNPTSADSIRASEAALTARAEARQQTFGRSWEAVARLMAAVRDGRDVQDITASVQWADPSTRSVAQEADAVTKLFAAGLLPASYALRKLGYSDDEIAEINAARAQDTPTPTPMLTERSA